MSIQARNNPFLVMAGLYFTVGLIAVVGKLAIETGLIDALPRIRWLTIHFVTIGGMTQALFGAFPALVDDVQSDSGTVGSRSRWSQWLLLNAGYPLVVVGMATGEVVTAVAGAALVLGALVGLLVTIYRMRSSGGYPRRYFRTAPLYLVVGILAAFGMLLNVHGPGGYFGSIEAHVHANVWGFLALAVAGVLLVALPRLFEAERRYPTLQRVTYWGITIGAAGLVAGPWLARHELTVAGLGVYVAGTVALLVTVVGTYRNGERPQPERLALVLGAYLWLVFPVPWAPLVLLFPDAVPAMAIERSAIDGLVFGWMLQLAMAFLPLAVLAVKDGESDFVGRVRTASSVVGRPSSIQIASVNAGVLLLWAAAFWPSSGGSDLISVVGYLAIAVAWAIFLTDLWSALAATPIERASGPVSSD